MKLISTFLLSSIFSLPILAQCTNNIHLETQADVDEFVNVFNCTSIDGNLIIGDDSFPYDGSDVSDLSGLTNLTSISGHLQIFYNALLLDLTGLENITNVTGKLELTYNDGLTSLAGIANLASVGENVMIAFNTTLTDFSGLENLTSIGGDLTIWGNAALTNVSGLNNLTNVGEDLEIWSNASLSNLSGFDNLVSIGEDLEIENNDALLNLSGLNNLSFIEETIIISDNTSLIDLSALDNVININGDLSIHNNNNLQIISFQNLANIGGALTVFSNNTLTNLLGFINLMTVGGNLEIENNNALSELNGFNNLTNIQGSFKIIDNPNLTNLLGFNNLNTITQTLWIEDNANLSNCCVFSEFIGVTQGSTYILNNSMGCDSATEVVSFCIAQLIQAQAFYDENQNGIYDSEEQFIEQLFSLQPYAFYSLPSQEEGAHFYLNDFDNYTLQLQNINPLWELNEGFADSIEIAFFDTDFSDTMFYFPMQPIALFTIYDIDLSSSITRCNQQTNYWLTYTNNGTTIDDGYIQLVPDEITYFVSANPQPDSTAGDTLFWFYEDLFPSHSKQIQIIYQMPGFQFIGEDVDFEADIQTWEGLGDNKAILSSEFICAYDPNDKLVTPAGFGPENYTLYNDTLEYTIRFQNTGNDTAFTVIVKDTLDNALDINSFRIIANSHPLETSIDGNSRIVTFAFEDIYLPDSFVNEPASHGLVKFQISTNDSLANFINIQNTAGIFFDFNPPIVTNTVSNTFTSEIPSVFFG